MQTNNTVSRANVLSRIFYIIGANGKTHQWLVLFIYYLGVYTPNGTQTTIWVCVPILLIVKLTYEPKLTRKMMFNNCHLYSSFFCLLCNCKYFIYLNNIRLILINGYCKFLRQIYFVHDRRHVQLTGSN